MHGRIMFSLFEPGNFIVSFRALWDRGWGCGGAAGAVEVAGCRGLAGVSSGRGCNWGLAFNILGLSKGSHVFFGRISFCCMHCPWTGFLVVL